MHARPWSLRLGIRLKCERLAVALHDPRIDQALQLIWGLSEYPVSVKEVVNRLPVTRRTLERKFRDGLGRTILEEINRCHLERAKRLLSNTELSITEVAAAAGFSSIDTMGKVFQRVLNMSPGNYRCRLENIAADSSVAK